jgi:hypothetical protein
MPKFDVATKHNAERLDYLAQDLGVQVEWENIVALLATPAGMFL